MPSNEQRRQAAKRKLDRQLARRAERARRRRTIAVSTTVVVVVAVVAGVFYFTRTGGSETEAAAQPPTPTPTPAEQPEPTSGPCHYTPTPQQPAAKPVDLPKDPSPTPAEGTVPVNVQTSQGDIGLTLDRAKAPCTVQSFVHLAESNFFDDTSCHRLTTGKALQVLQCGDPTGKGTGGPGYKFEDELPENLEPAPEKFQSKKGTTRIYPRGTLAMANSGPDTNGSQFFMVYEDSYLPPKYTVFGSISEQGLKVLDKVASEGTEPGGTKPKLPVRIKQVAIEA